MERTTMNAKHTPLKLIAPGRIETADGWSIYLNWYDNRHGDNPWQQAEEFAPHIVRAVNCFDEMLAALRAQEDLAALRFEGEPEDAITSVRNMRRAAIAKATANPLTVSGPSA
jgi:hypothetical protein